MKESDGVKNKLKKIRLSCKSVVFIGKTFISNKKATSK